MLQLNNADSLKCYQHLRMPLPPATGTLSFGCSSAVLVLVPDATRRKRAEWDGYKHNLTLPPLAAGGAAGTPSFHLLWARSETLLWFFQLNRWINAYV